jgi:hypothetical protein
MLKPQTKRLRLVLVLVLASVFVLGAAGISWLAYSFLSSDSSRNRASAIDCTLEWGRLAPFPPSAQQLAVSTHGSMFTREFRLSFAALPQDIEEWLQRSPGTREAIVTTPSPGVRHFQITPGGGAEFAEVTVDDAEHRVFIRVYWS